MKLRAAPTVLVLAIMVVLALPGLGLAQSGSNAAVEAYNRGTNLLNSERYREAISCFDEAIRLDPRYTGAYNNRGIAYERLKTQGHQDGGPTAFLDRLADHREMAISPE